MKNWLIEPLFKKCFYMVIFCCLIVFTGCAELLQRIAVSDYQGPFLVPAEEPVPGVPEEVKFADYWIRNNPDPDELILSSEEIEAFNRKNPVSGAFLFDISEMSKKSDGVAIRKYLADNARYLENVNFFVTGKIPLEKAVRQRIIALMDTAGVPDVITFGYGITLHRVMGKIWPTKIPLFEKEGDNEFDQGIASSLDMATPVAMLHTSKDGLWSFVQTPRFLCWLPSDAIALGDIKTIMEFVNCNPPLVAVGNKVSVFGDPEKKNAIGSIQMGSYLPLRTAGNDFCEVLVPGRGKNGELVAYTGYVRRSSDVSIGFLPYTFRNVYRQCFVLFGHRFGWGGMYDERDCSGYIMDVFRCFNIQLPRNSAEQAKASNAVIFVEDMDRKTRLELLKSVPCGISLLRMPGHIMIYLGEFNGTPYAISDFWAWRTPSKNGKDIAHRVARVAVTDLMLGEGSKRGAFIDRLSHITILGNYVIREK